MQFDGGAIMQIIPDVWRRLLRNRRFRPVGNCEV